MKMKVFFFLVYLNLLFLDLDWSDEDLDEEIGNLLNLFNYFYKAIAN